jgi:TRAP-type C4-dicarboxylate transport system substrate-binding protein
MKRLRRRDANGEDEMKISLGWAIAVALLLPLYNPVKAAEEKLIFAEVVPPDSVIDAKVVQPWAQRVNEQGKGILSIDVRSGPSLADFSNVYDRVLSNVIQVGWEIQAAVGGKFPLSNVVALPLITDNSVDSSVAFWRLYQSGLLKSEYDQVVPIMLVTLPPSTFHFAKPLTTLDTLSGSKLIVPSKVAGDALAALGGAPISLPLTEMYPAIQRGTVDGAMIAWVAFNPWKLAEVTSYHVDVAFGGAAGMIFMAKAKYDSLSPAARKIIDANSGEAPSRAFGQAMTTENDNQRAIVAASAKQTIVTLSPSQLASWQKKITPTIEQWSKATKGGDVVLARFRTELANIKAGH